MRWLAVIAGLFAGVSHAVEMNNTGAISASIKDPEAFRFFYIGHAYGAHKEKGYWKSSKVAYPHPEILRNLASLRKFDFAVFGGDTVERCNDESIAAFERYLAVPLAIPVLNSIGNHDRCMKERYGIPVYQSFAKGTNVFAVINTQARQLDGDQQTWLVKQIGEFKASTAARRLFIFTHRPAFLALAPEMAVAASRANFPVVEEQGFAASIGTALADIGPDKSVYWFAGDIGIKMSHAYHTLYPNVHLIASGVYERAADHYLSIAVSADKVQIQSINLYTGAATNIEEYTVPENIERTQPHRRPDDEGWASNLLAKIYSSVGIGEGERIKPKKIEGKEEIAFDFFYHPKTKSLLLSREDCGESGDILFYVQFHPVRVEDRHTNWEWNGYHFNAERTGRDQTKCIATVPLPDYKFKFALIGQIDQKQRVWNAILPYSHIYK